ncbi:membrane protein [Mycobacterium tuberculosis]|nr:membrane protein [Mycobacterium tuberculosis]CKP02730.1 membrane protein [Mycobacterium tuberculosis]
MLLGILTLLLSACQTASASGYNEPRGYDRATLKLVFSMDLGMCLNRFTYDSKLAPSRPQVVACDSREARIRTDSIPTLRVACGSTTN